MRHLSKILAGSVLACLWLLGPAPAFSRPAPAESPNLALEEPPAASDTESAPARFVPPPDDQHDWLQLKSDEWLKGHLQTLYNDKLEFDSDKLKRLTFDWTDVKWLRTAAPRTIQIELPGNGWQSLTVIGRIEMRGDTLTVVTGEQRQRYPRDRIVSIGTRAKREADYWSGKFSLGANLRTGNTELVDVSLIANTRRLTARSRFVADYVGNYSQTRNDITSNNHRLNGYYDRFMSSRFFWRVLNGEYYRDELKNIAHQISAGTAFGYDVIRDSKTDWEVSGGLGVSYKRYVSVEPGENPEETSPSLRLGTRFDTSLSPSVDFKLNYRFQILDKASGTYTHHVITTLSSDLWADVDLDVSFVWDRVQDPRPGADGIVPKRDDYQLIVGIGYDF